MPEAKPKFNQHSLLVILKCIQLTIMRGYIPPIQSFQICFRRFSKDAGSGAIRKPSAFNSIVIILFPVPGPVPAPACTVWIYKTMFCIISEALSSCISRNDLHGIPKSSERLSWLKTWDKECITPEQLEQTYISTACCPFLSV